MTPLIARRGQALALAAMLSCLPLVPAGAADNRCGPTHVAQDGEALTDIATRCGVTLSALMMANPTLDGTRPLTPGADVTVPSSVVDTRVQPLQGTRDAAPASGPRHVVERGDTFASIATQYGITVPALELANPGLSDRDLRPGGRVVLPTGTGGPDALVADVPVTLEGRLSAGLDCPVVTTDTGEVVGLSGDTAGFTNGDHVAIEGMTVAPDGEGTCTRAGRTVRIGSIVATEPPSGYLGR